MSIVHSTCAGVILGILAQSASAQVPPVWPIEPTDGDHPLGATLGEFQDMMTEQCPCPSVYQHTGLDILARPWKGVADDNIAPWVVVTVGGKVVWFNDQPYTQWNGTDIVAADGKRYRYYHLAHGSYDNDYFLAYQNNSTEVVVGDAKIARVTAWGKCEYDHLHYDVGDGVNYQNPVVAIGVEANPDWLAPEIFDIDLADYDQARWAQFSAAGVACTSVKGKVDIIAQVRDRDDAGSTLPGASNIGVYRLRWRACPKDTPECGTWSAAHTFATMPIAWERLNNDATKAQFSTDLPWESDFDECSSTVNQTFMVATSPPSGTWNTMNGAYPNGSYSVSVEAIDFAGNVTVRNLHACVQNGPGCTPDLTVRDGATDTGAVPYIGSDDLLSPDIRANPGTPDENVNVNVGAANVIEVRAWNTGTCPLASGTTYNVCIGWNQSSAPLNTPVPASQTVGCQAVAVPAGGWTPGTSRVTTFNWTPAASVPTGPIRLEAWSNMAADPVQNSVALTHDNNRAARIVSAAP